MDIRTRIIEHLKKKGTYDSNIDDDMVEEMIENSVIARKCLKDIKKDGVIIEYTTTNGSLMTKMNPMVGIYQMFCRNTNQLASKLGINRSDRLKLKIIEAKESTEFDELSKS